MTPWALGIDVGGTNLKAVAISADGIVRRMSTRATEGGAEAVAAWTRAAQDALADFTRYQGGAPVAIGVCAPGLADADGRSIAQCPGKLAGLEGFDWTRALERTAVVPVLN